MAGESKLQSYIRRKLESHGWYVTKVISSSKPGWPDLLGLRNGTAIFIEVKDKKKKPKPLQVYVHEKISEQKFLVFSIDSKELFLEKCLIHNLY